MSRRITANVYLSLDGVVEAPENWHFPYHDDATQQAVTAGLQAADTLLLGRKTYDIFAATWPDRDGEMADWFNFTPRLVVSSTLRDPQWKNTTVLAPERLVEELSELKQQPGRAIAVHGSIRLVRTLLDHGLLDDLVLMLHPLVVGSGQRLFPENGPRLPLRLRAATTFGSSIQSLTYSKDN
ncbi:dihydrofolate reductase family protein [Nocardia stercoris]|uniref:Dihydrofolate reductase n=1 Tax=Nocardia stercoris TaxID=2483361 RepID=A0A3M2L697_9NOCA|nr:dihydrofolate reductase family protein [Nocardia stercoris]RMI31435.1 dihydrofolate reductase [Nocardia stercoris]